MNFKSTILYFLYTITAFFVFAWVFFPDQKAGKILSDRVSTLNEHVEVQINKATPGVMLTCELKQTDIIINNKFKFTLDYFKLSPSLLSMFSSKKKATFEINKGSLSINKINLTFNAKGELLKVNDLQVGGNISLSDIITKIDDMPILHLIKMSELNFSNIDFEFIRNKDKLKIINFYAKGVQFNIKAKGNLSMSPKSGDINLDLETNIQPNPSYLSKFAGISSVTPLVFDSKQGIKLHIGGTLENPIIKL